MELSKLQRLQKILFAGINFRKICAFTLAEMMVVMLIMSIIMAAMAPVMTRKQKTDTSSPWKWSAVGSPHAYFGVNGSQTALIGEQSPAAGDPANKLTINSTNDNVSHLLFKRGNNVSGILNINPNGGLLYGNIDVSNVGSNSLAIGHSAKAGGDYAIALGYNTNSSGVNSIGIGHGASTSDKSVAIGNNARSQVSADAHRSTMYNVAVGFQSVATGGNNDASGQPWVSRPSVAYGAYSSASGQSSVALGSGALASHDGSIAIGSYASGITGGGSGAQALGESSIAIGKNAIARAEGALALGNDSKAGDRVTESGTTTVTGKNSIAMGNGASAPELETIAIGYNARATKKGALAIGSSVQNPVYASIYNKVEATGEYAVALGGYASAQGEASIVIGKSSLARYKDTIAIGDYSRAGDINTIAIGNNNYAYGNGSIAIGRNINMENLAGDYSNTNRVGNVVIGYHLANGESTEYFYENSVPASQNTIIGHLAGNKLTTGYRNTALGSHALLNNKEGSNNIAIGVNACQNVTGSNKVCIGNNSGPASGFAHTSDGSNVIYLGNSSSTVYITGNLVVDGTTYLGYKYDLQGRLDARKTYAFYEQDMDNDNPNTNKQVRKGTSALYLNMGSRYDDRAGIAGPLLYTYENDSHMTVSDRRLKYVGAENKDGLAKIRQLKVFNYTFKKDEKKTPRVGVIAQDLQKVFPNAVKKGEDGFLSIRWDDMFYAVINAIKELDFRVKALEKENKLLREQNKALEARLKALEDKIK